MTDRKSPNLYRCNRQGGQILSSPNNRARGFARSLPTLTSRFSPCYVLAMFDRTATTVACRAFLVLLATVFAACAATHPVPPPPVAPSPPSPPPVARIPGEPVALTPAEEALGHFLRAEVAANQGDQDTALTEIERAVADDPDSPFLRLRLATLYVRKGKLAEALEHCQKVVAEEPDNTEAQLLLAGLLSSANREE